MTQITTVTTETIRLEGGDALHVARLDPEDGPSRYALYRGFEEERSEVVWSPDLEVPADAIGDLIEALRALREEED